MVLDRAADSQSAPTLPAGVTSSYLIPVFVLCVFLGCTDRYPPELLGFDGIVLEVTDVGDVLAVMMF